MCFDSSSSSQANTTSTTQTTDARVVGGNASTNVSASGSTVTVTDAGAINAAFGFAAQTVQGALAQVAQSDAAAKDQITAALDSVKSAWSEAKQGEQKILVGMGLIIVGIVGIRAVKKG